MTRALVRQDILKLLASIIIPLAAGGIGSLFTTPNIATWYRDIAKSELTPPNWVFGPVWTTLFILMGVALFLVWRRDRDVPVVRSTLALFGLQLVLNVLWSVAFFGMRSPLNGLIVIGLLWIAIAATIWQFSKISTPAALLMAPYICWVSFAAYLNARVWQLN